MEEKIICAFPRCKKEAVYGNYCSHRHCAAHHRSVDTKIRKRKYGLVDAEIIAKNYRTLPKHIPY